MRKTHILWIWCCCLLRSSYTPTLAAMCPLCTHDAHDLEMHAHLQISSISNRERIPGIVNSGSSSFITCTPHKYHTTLSIIWWYISFKIYPVHGSIPEFTLLPAESNHIEGWRWLQAINIWDHPPISRLVIILLTAYLGCTLHNFYHL